MSLFPRPTQTSDISPATLAFIGDAVYELHVRMGFIFPPKTNHVYHQLVVAKVRAEYQAQKLDQLLNQAYLHSHEIDLVRRGRNAAGNASRHLDPVIYQKATGFETLVGYLYLTDCDRLEQIFEFIECQDHEAKTQTYL